MTKQLKVAIVHDWLVGGGAERVVEQLHYMYPDAPIYTSYVTDEWRAKLNGKVVTGWLQRFGKLRKFMVLGRIWWFTHLDLSEFDIVISSSGNGEAKSIRVPETTTHICYCNAPTHFYWRHYEQYLASPGFGKFDWLARIGLWLLLNPLRWWDKNRAAPRPDVYLANSSHTAREIKEFYNRDATVVFPPVDTARFSSELQPKQKTGYVTAGRQTGYKHTDIIIEACNALQLPLTVIGRGPEHEKLAAMAGPTISFRTDVTDDEMPKLIAASKAFIFAAYEDFGITPVEAMAAGTPVIAYKAGGALDYVTSETGVFFEDQTATSLIKALQTFDPTTYTKQNLQAKAKEFSVNEFRKRFRSATKGVFEK